MKKLNLPGVLAICSLFGSPLCFGSHNAEFEIHLEPDPEFDTTRYDGWDGGLRTPYC